MHQEFSFEDFYKSADVERIFDKSGSSAEWLGINNTSNAPWIIATIAKNGDLATTSRVEETRLAASVDVAKAVNVKNKWNDAALVGPRVNMTRLVTGQPRPFGRFERQRQTAPKVLTVYVPIGGLGGLSAEEIGFSTVAGIVAVDLLETAGYRCEVWGASCADGDYGPQQIRVKLKEASDPADINAISRIAHPVIFRGLVLSLRHDKGRNRTASIDPARFSDERKCVVIKHTYSMSEVVSEVARVISEVQA